MRKGTLHILLLALAVSWIGWGCAGSERVVKKDLLPSLVIYPGVVKMDKTAKVTLIGSGFEHGKSFRLVIVTEDGITTDIDYSFDPKPVTNPTGAWVSEWKDLGRFIEQELIKEGAYTIWVTDSEYNPIAQAPIGVVAEKKKK